MTFDKILEGFYRTSQSELDAPFDSLLLNYLSEIGSFDRISLGDWEQFYKADERYKERVADTSLQKD